MNTHKTDPFAGMGDDLPFDSAPVKETKIDLPATAGSALFVEPCPKCGGSGLWRNRPSFTCFGCKGSGKKSYKTSAKARASSRASAAKAKAGKASKNWESFASDEPVAAKWILAKEATFDFAASMKTDVEKWGSLTNNKMAAVMRCVERDEARAKARAESVANAPVVEVDTVSPALRKVKEAGLKYPKLRLTGLMFSLAPDHGRNAGATYVKEWGGEYLGKIVDNKFHRARACDDTTEGKIMTAMADAEAAAKAYGLETGVCACCGRELTNKVSIERGIGPICAERFGFL